MVSLLVSKDCPVFWGSGSKTAVSRLSCMVSTCDTARQSRPGSFDGLLVVPRLRLYFGSTLVGAFTFAAALAGEVRHIFKNKLLPPSEVLGEYVSLCGSGVAHDEGIGVDQVVTRDASSWDIGGGPSVRNGSSQDCRPR